MLLALKGPAHTVARTHHRVVAAPLAHIAWSALAWPQWRCARGPPGEARASLGNTTLGSNMQSTLTPGPNIPNPHGQAALATAPHARSEQELAAVAGLLARAPFFAALAPAARAVSARYATLLSLGPSEDLALAGCGGGRVVRGGGTRAAGRGVVCLLSHAWLSMCA